MQNQATNNKKSRKGKIMAIGKRIEPEQAVKIEQFIPHAIPLFTLADLILPETTQTALLDFLAYRKHEARIFNEWGLAKTHQHQRQTAINLYGLPGTGKTMAAHAVAHELGMPLIMVNYAELESKYVGETSKNIARLFADAQQQGAIIFFDEADAILSRRVSNMSNSTDVSVNQTRSVMLTLMNQHDGLIIFTTNFIENYDPAFMRRILAHIHFTLPDQPCRVRLWHQYIPAELPHSVDIPMLAAFSEGLSGSDISNCVLKAAMSAARQNALTLDAVHFRQAIDEVITSKSANERRGGEGPVKVKERIVSEDYVKGQINSKQLEEMKS